MIDEIVDPHQVTLIVIMWYLMSFSEAVMAHCHLKRSNFEGIRKLLCAGTNSGAGFS
jgi:hypothetical protein